MENTNAVCRLSCNLIHSSAVLKSNFAKIELYVFYSINSKMQSFAGI